MLAHRSGSGPDKIVLPADGTAAVLGRGGSAGFIDPYMSSQQVELTCATVGDPPTVTIRAGGRIHGAADLIFPELSFHLQNCSLTSTFQMLTILFPTLHECSRPEWLPRPQDRQR